MSDLGELDAMDVPAGLTAISMNSGSADPPYPI
jgi:hypothetical protein